MKTFLMALMMAATTNVWAQNWIDSRPEEVLKVVSVTTVEDTHEVTEESFNPNLDGYARPWPGIIASEYVMNYHAKLRHGNGFDNNGLRIVFQQGTEFCGGGWQTGEKVFGPEYILGAKFHLKYTIKREVVSMTNHDGRKHKFLKETVSTKVLKCDVRSTAYVGLEASGE